jgi:hypothetical protein
MSEVTSNLESIAKDLGINISDSVEGLQNAEPQPALQTEPQGDESQYEQVDAGSSLTADQGVDDSNRVVYSSEFGASSSTQDDSVSHEEAMQFISSYLSENLGVDIDPIINGGNSNTAEIDERLLPILEFVRDTGRSPEDWFRYQMLNPSEMDDLSLVQMQMSLEYPELTQEEVGVLIDSKYKVSENQFLDDKERKMADLQLKIDANKARQQINGLRENYLSVVETARQVDNVPTESFVDDEWVQGMVNDVEQLEGIDFSLPGDKTFTFGLNNEYKQHLVSKNAELDSFFDQYVDNSGNWNHELFNMHRTVVDNIDEIVKAVYNQGMSDGQRRVVQNAANVQSVAPGIPGVNTSSSLSQQIESILASQDSMMRVKF